MPDTDDNAAQVLEWAEKNGLENLRMRVESAALLSKAAETTLTVLLAGIGGSLAYALKVFDPAPTPATIGAAAVCTYLMFLAGILVWKCLMARSVPAVHNEPANLNQPSYLLAALRQVELENMQERIVEWTTLNATTARRLNRLRLAATATPIVFVAVAGFATVLASRG